MPGSHPVFDYLATEKNPAADSALLAALPGADDTFLYQLIRTLLERQNRKGLRGLIQYYHLIPDAVRARLDRRAEDLTIALRESLQSKEEQDLRNVIDIIQRGALYRSSYLLDITLRHRDPHLREHAADALHRLCEDLYHTSPLQTGELTTSETAALSLEQRMQRLVDHREDHRQIAATLDATLTSFHVHLHPRALEPAMWFVEDIEARFWAMMTAPGSKAARVAMTLLEGTRDLRLVTFCILALKHGSFRPRVARLFEDPPSNDFLDEWFTQSWRLCQPKVRRGTSAMKVVACLNEPDAYLAQVAPNAQRHVPRWILATGVSDDRKRLALRELTRNGHPHGQRAAMDALTHLKDENATALLRQIAGQASPPLAILARLELARRQPEEYPPGLLLKQVRALKLATPPNQEEPEDSSLKLNALIETPESRFDAYWHHYDDYSPNERMYRGKTLFLRDPQTIDLLRERIKADQPGDKLRGLAIITAADIAKSFRDELQQLSHDDDSEVRSAAVTALGRLPDATSKHLVRKALVDGDARVQANAIEAVGDDINEHTRQELMLKLASPNNRVRANAVRALLKLGVREAAQTLVAMLDHSHRGQRVSALWLVDQLGLASVWQRVATLAESEQDEKIRARARGLADRLKPDRPPASDPVTPQTTEVNG